VNTRLAVVLDLSLPPGLSPDDLQHAYQRFHLPWLRELVNRGQPGLTLVVNSWLLGRWLEWGWEEGLTHLRVLYDYGKVEWCATASHHTILPLAPESVGFRQVRRNLRLLQQLLHPEWRPAGFSPPALAYGHELVRLLAPLGFRWCLADDSSFAALHGWVPHVHVTRCGPLHVLLCSRLWSERLRHLGQIGPKRFAATHRQELDGWFGGNGYQVLRLVAHHYEQAPREAFFAFLDEHQQRGTLLTGCSALLDVFASHEGEVPPGSCFTRPEDFWQGAFFAPWRGAEADHAWQASEEAILELEEWQNQLDELLSSQTFEDGRGPGGANLAAYVQRLRAARQG
jgi:hypothetical protein